MPAPTAPAPAGKAERSRQGPLGDRARSQRHRTRPGQAPGGRPLWLMWPGQLCLLVIIAVPLAVGVYISLLDLNQYSLRTWVSAPFVALQNYTEALFGGNILGTSALQSLLVSIGFSVLTTILITPIGILAALSVHSSFRGRGLVRTLYLVPYTMPIFVTALLGRMAFLNGGLVNQGLHALHITSGGTYWLVGPKSFWALVAVDTWSSWSFVYIMILGGLQLIPTDLYEAAELDGAGYWQKLARITFPQMRQILALALLISTLNHFNNFTLPFVMFGTPPPSAADVLPLNIWVTSFQLFRFGLGAAMSIITLVLMLIPGYVYFRAVRLGTTEVKA
jgi:multiple sugar transport system permease protein